MRVQVDASLRSRVVSAMHRDGDRRACRRSGVSILRLWVLVSARRLALEPAGRLGRCHAAKSGSRRFRILQLRILRQLGMFAVVPILAAAVLAPVYPGSGAATSVLAAWNAPAQDATWGRPPVAKAEPKAYEAHGRTRIDDYAWLSDRDDPDVISYIEAENAHTAERLKPLQPLIEKIETELRERADGARVSVDFTDRGYVYQRRFSEGARYPIILRRPLAGSAPEQVILDVERLAAGHDQYHLANYVQSPSGEKVAFAVDFTGGRAHHVFLRDIRTDQVADTGIADAAPDLVFSTDSREFFYVRLESDTLRAYQLWRHAIGSPPSRDTLVYEETDSGFELGLSLSKSKRFILLRIEHQQTSEVRYLPAERPYESFRVLERRQRGVIYTADHIGDMFFIQTNLNAPDFRLVRAPEAAPNADNWAEIHGETPGHPIVRFELFNAFIAFVEEHRGSQSVRVLKLDGLREIEVPRPSPIGIADISFAQGAANRDPEATVLQIRFAGPLHPNAVYDFNTMTGELALAKKSLNWTWFDPAAYEARRVDVAAADGEMIPVTLTYRKDRLRLGGNPILITGYGAYGSSTLDEFPGTWVSLIDRGFVFAQAHVRGGQENGRRWHDLGRLLQKRNTFTDFIAASEALIRLGIADPHYLFANGRSAGGLLMGAVANLRPDLFAGIVAEVPFVDVVTTMSDRTIALTTLEYDEWGDPAVKALHDYMLSYSPYDNVAAQAYPAMFVTTALNDTQVNYFEPVKWVARLRARKTDDRELLLQTNMKTGHSGETGRFGSLTERAQIMAWLIARVATTGALQAPSRANGEQ